MTASPYRSPWLDDEIVALKDMATKFYQIELLPNEERFAAQKSVDRAFWNKAGNIGLLCAGIPEEYGGGGGTVAHDFAIFDAQYRSGDTAFGNMVHSGLVAHYLLAYATEEQKLRWLPKLATGEFVGAIAMTEPGAGSDLKRCELPRFVTVTTTSSTAPRRSSRTASTQIWSSLRRRRMRRPARKECRWSSSKSPRWTAIASVACSTSWA